MSHYKFYQWSQLWWPLILSFPPIHMHPAHLWVRFLLTLHLTKGSSLHSPSTSDYISSLLPKGDRMLKFFLPKGFLWAAQSEGKGPTPATKGAKAFPEWEEGEGRNRKEEREWEGERKKERYINKKVRN